MILRTIGLMLLCMSPLFIVVWSEPINNYMDSLYIEIDHVGIVTDKWIKRDTAFWVFGNKDRFYLEINDDTVEEVEDKEYYNFEIGSYRNWTTTKLKDT